MEAWKDVKDIILQMIDNETLIIVFLFAVAYKIISMLGPGSPEWVKTLATSSISAIIGGFIGYLRGVRTGQTTSMVDGDQPPKQPVS